MDRGVSDTRVPGRVFQTRDLVALQSGRPQQGRRASLARSERLRKMGAGGLLGDTPGGEASLCRLPQAGMECYLEGRKYMGPLKRFI